jgi:hypothetical protein
MAPNERRMTRREMIRAMSAESHSGHNSPLTRSHQRSFHGSMPNVIRRGHASPRGNAPARQSYTSRRAC